MSSKENEMIRVKINTGENSSIRDLPIGNAQVYKRDLSYDRALAACELTIKEGKIYEDADLQQRAVGCCGLSSVKAVGCFDVPTTADEMLPLADRLNDYKDDLCCGCYFSKLRRIIKDYNAWLAWSRWYDPSFSLPPTANLKLFTVIYLLFVAIFLRLAIAYMFLYIAFSYGFILILWKLCAVHYVKVDRVETLQRKYGRMKKLQDKHRCCSSLEKYKYNRMLSGMISREFEEYFSDHFISDFTSGFVVDGSPPDESALSEAKERYKRVNAEIMMKNTTLDYIIFRQLQILPDDSPYYSPASFEDELKSIKDFETEVDIINQQIKIIKFLEETDNQLGYYRGGPGFFGTLFSKDTQPTQIITNFKDVTVAMEKLKIRNKSLNDLVRFMAVFSREKFLNFLERVPDLTHEVRDKLKIKGICIKRSVHIVNTSVEHFDVKVYLKLGDQAAGMPLVIEIQATTVENYISESIVNTHRIYEERR